MGGGDVKYHIGATASTALPDGEIISLHLASNPSHLEAVDPVLLGRARAKQERIGDGGKRTGASDHYPWRRCLRRAGHPGRDVEHGRRCTDTTSAGPLHVIVNNLLGFTANPEESNSSRFSTDIAKRLPIPIFHVNAEDP